MPGLDPVGEATLVSLGVGDLDSCGVPALEPALDPLGDVICCGVADLEAGFDPCGVAGFEPCGVGGFASWGVAALEPCGVGGLDPCGVACLEPTGVPARDPSFDAWAVTAFGVACRDPDCDLDSSGAGDPVGITGLGGLEVLGVAGCEEASLPLATDAGREPGKMKQEVTYNFPESRLKKNQFAVIC